MPQNHTHKSVLSSATYTQNLNVHRRASTNVINDQKCKIIC